MGKIDKKVLISLYIILTILRPSPINLMGNTAAKLIIELVWFLFTIILYLTFNPKFRFGRVFFVFFCSVGISILLNPTYLLNKFNLNDTYEVLLILNYFLILNLGLNIKINEQEFEELILKPFNTALIVVLLITFLSLFNDTFYKFIQNVYFFKTAGMYSTERVRVSGTFTNPNHFSIFLNFAAIVTLYYFNKYKHTRLFKIFLLSELLLTLALILFTGSRTGMVILIFNIVGFLLISVNKASLGKVFTIFILLGTIVYFNLEFILEKLPQRFRSTISLIEVGGVFAIDSLRIKFELSTLRFSDVFSNAPFFGYGPSNNITFDLGDNQIMSILYKYGFIGLMLFLSIFFLDFFKLKKGKYFKFFPLIFLVAFLTGGFFYNPQLSLIYFILVGILIKNRSEFSY